MVNIITFSHKFLKKCCDGESSWPVRGALCLAVLIAYACVWSNGFLFNDGILIVQDKFLRNWNSLPDLLTHLSNAGYGLSGGFYRPLEMLIYFLIYQAFGASTIAYHTLNLALHALNTCLLYHFGLRIGFRRGAVFAAALLWALHPLHTSNVAYMSSTAELLWGAFCLAGLITLLPDFTPRKIYQALAFFIFALVCKESAVVFPALATATFFLVSRERMKISAYLKLWPLWLVSVCYTAAWVLFMHKTNYSIQDVGDPAYIASFTNRLLTAFAALPVYARLMIWPAGLHIEWLFPTFSTLLAWQPIAGVLLAGLGLLQVFIPHKSSRGRALSFGLLWLALAFAPYTGIVIPVDAVISEGWMYVPLMGFFLGVAQGLSGFFEKKKQAALLLVLALALPLGVKTFFQVEIWRNAETLYLDNVRHQDWGRSVRLYIIGMFYLHRGEFEKAIEQFQEEIDHPDSDPLLASAHMWLAMAWLQVGIENNSVTLEALNRALPSAGHIPEAIGELGKALQENPDFYQVHKILAAIYTYQGNKRMADFHDRKAADILQKQEGHRP